MTAGMDPRPGLAAVVFAATFTVLALGRIGPATFVDANGKTLSRTG